MAITDLTGTYWIIDKLPKYGNGQAPYLGSKSITFTNDNDTYYGLLQTQEAYYEVVLNYKTSPSGSNYTKVFDGRQYDGWDDTVYQDIYITGGTDVTNSDLISFLETYATEGTQIDYLTTDRELNSVANAIRTKGSTSAGLVYPNGFITAINAIPTGATLQSKTVNPSTTSQTVLPDSGYDGLSSVTVNAMPSGSATTPATTITSNPTIGINSNTGIITASNSGTQSVTPTVSAGYISSGTAGTITVNGSHTMQLTTKAATTYTPTTSDQTIAKGTYLTGIQTISGDANLVASNIKSGTSIFGVTGSYTGGASNIVQGTFTTPSTTGAASSFTIPYTGSGYPIALTIYIDGGPYNHTSSGNTTWYNSTQRYAIGVYNMIKSEITTTPTYTTTGSVNYGTVQTIYKNSASTATTYGRTSSMTVNTYTSSSTNATSNSTACVRFKGNKTTVSYYVASSSYGLLASTKYAYVAVYSS